MVITISIVILTLVALAIILPSIRVIGATEIGLVRKRYGASLSEDNPIAFKGEAGYQADMLMPGWRFKFWIPYSVEKYPWVQIPAGEIGVVIAQVGEPLPIGAKSARYNKELRFDELKTFIENGGQKGVQRPVLPPGTLSPFHPIGFLVITKNKVYGKPISTELISAAKSNGGVLTPTHFGLKIEQLRVVRIEPSDSDTRKGIIDVIGVVTTFEGEPLPPGDIASRIGGFDDIAKLKEDSKITDADLIETIIGSKNNTHNNYQDFQAFLDAGGKMGLQHDPLLYGAYLLNPFLVKVDTVPMLVVEQGEVAVIKSYVGLMTEEKLKEAGNYGNLVRPGYRGIWREPLRTGKYAIVPNCYQAEIVPISIITLNWSEHESKAYKLDTGLKQIVAKSKEGFVFSLDLQVQIHVPDDRASKVISMVGTMQNLVGDVLQAAVGNHFRDRLQSMPAVSFIETRQRIQEEAFEHINRKLSDYEVETLGVYIQDVKFPEQLVVVLTQREIANQQIATYKKQQEAEQQRIDMEKTKGTADKQAELAAATVGVEIKTKNAEARKAEADGEATYISQTGTAKGAEVKAVGMARAEAFEKQVNALGKENTALVNMITVLAEKNLKFVPEIVAGGEAGLGGLIAILMKKLADRKPEEKSDMIAQ